jgi:ABC-type glucose/galactose transport system permease subunit
MTKIDRLNRKGWIMVLCVVAYQIAMFAGIVWVPSVYLNYFMIAGALGTALILWGLVDLFVESYRNRNENRD